jgi:mycothiol synthase
MSGSPRDTQAATPDASIDVSEAPPIPGLRFRHYGGPVDHPAMVRVSNAQAAADGDPERLTVDTFDSEYQNLTNCDPSTDILMAEVAGEVIAFAQVEWLDDHEGSRRYDLYGVVDPAWRRRGIGAAMFRHGMRRARQLGDDHQAAGETAHRDRWLRAWGEDTNAGNTELLRAHGFRPLRRQSLMVLDELRAIDVPPLPQGLEVRGVVPTDHRAIFDANCEAFRDSFWGSDGSDNHYQRWVGAPDFDPHLLVIGWAGDEVAGGVWCAIDPAENEANGYLRGWIESVFTRAPWRERGLARALLARGLLRLSERGMTSAQLSVDMDNLHQALGLYQSLGFLVRRGTSVWRRDRD